jgi:hypothetical protein
MLKQGEFMKKNAFVLILSLLMLSGCGNSVKNDLPKNSDTKNNDSTVSKLDIADKTYSGTLYFFGDISELYCQSPDTDNFVVIFFNTKSDIGKRIFSICERGIPCKITGKVKWLKSNPYDVASAIGEFISIKADGVQKDECLHLKTPLLPKTGRTIHDFVPTGWKLIGQAIGDLNQDGLLDIVGVIENIQRYESCDADRVLFIAFKDFECMLKNEEATKRREDVYLLSIQTSKAIFHKYDGGVWGDPFILQDDYMRYKDSLGGIKDTRSRHFDETPGVFIDRGSLLIKHYGGSSWRWIYIHKFRYQNNGWYLIGYSSDSYHLASDWNPKSSGEGDWEDINYLTGKKISQETDHQGVTHKEKVTYVKKKKLRQLKDFNPAD